MAGASDHAMLARADEMHRRRLAIRRRHDTIHVPVQGDAGHADRRLRGEPLLQLRVRWVARSEAQAMSVGVDDDVDIVGVVEGACALLEGRVVEAPARRVAGPQQPRDLASVLRQPCTPAFGLEVVLVPESRFDLCGGRRVCPGNVLDQVAVDGDQPRAAFRPERGRHTSCASTPVITSQHGAGNVQRIQERDHVRAERRLLT
jgi:hypothetical protein